jgi:energy-coupling factor transport system permease protein
VAAAQLFASTMFTLLVGAIRRGTRLATAMDARGFDAGTRRTIARPQRFVLADAALVVAGALVGAGAIAISVALGTFTPLLA